MISEIWHHRDIEVISEISTRHNKDIKMIPDINKVKKIYKTSQRYRDQGYPQGITEI
jgi:hypothetical protein